MRTSDALGGRRLVIVAVSDYPEASDSFREGISTQVRLIRDWVHSAADAFDIAEAVWDEQDPGLVLERYKRQLRELTPDDAVLMYVTGHGTRGKQSREHRLLLSDHSRFRTADLALAAMTSGAQHVVVLVDSCHAGTLAREVFELLEDERQDHAELPSSCCIVVSGRPDESTRLREFATLIRRALDLLGTEKFAAPTGVEYLSPETFLQALRTIGRDEPVPPQLAWPNALSVSNEPCLALPNPRFDRTSVITSSSVRATSLTRGQVREYWIEKASGRPDPSDTGWYFSGRETLMTDVVRFLRDGNDEVQPGVLVLTGVSGSGKSALIARAVTLADPLFRAEPEFRELVAHLPERLVPPVGSVDAAVTARGLTVEQVAASLVAALASARSGAAGLEAATPEGPSLAGRLTRAVRPLALAAGRPLCLAIDGVDEAVDPSTVVRDLVSHLARVSDDSRMPMARFLLGARCTDGDDDTGLLGVIVRATQPVPVSVLRTDGVATRDDIAAYLAALLQTSSSPYLGDLQASRVVAAVVAEAVSPRFLDARVVGASLRAAATRQAVDDPVWRASLQDATVAQFAADLRSVSIDEGRPWPEILAVLRATAVARGAGIPWAEVWPTVASAVLGSPIPDADRVIAQVLGSRLSGYLTALSDAGTRVYRPNHERLTEVLRTEPHRLAPLERS